MRDFLRLIQPYLLAIAPLFSLFRNNPGEVFLSDFLLIAALLALVIFGLVRLVAKWTSDVEKASIAITILSLAIALSTELTSISKPMIWFCCLFCAMISIKIVFPSKWKSTLAHVFSLPLAAVIFYNGVEIGCVKRSIHTEIAKMKLDELPEKKFLKSCSKDVYVIILDEFISEKAFNDYYNCDHSSFFNYLRDKNFQIIPSSTSNYPWTITSIASILNFDYHDTKLSKNVFTGVAQFLIEKNKLFQLLERENYTIHHIPSIYWMGNPPNNPISDFLVRTKSYGFVQAISQVTPWQAAYRAYQRSSHRSHVLFQLEELKSLSEKPHKKLAFAHIMSPHRPITFTEEGKSLSEQEVVEAEKDAKHKFYLGQAKFISREVIKTIDHILAHSAEPPLILVLSDHGKFPIGSSPKGKKTLPIKEISWRFSNLQALYLPDFDGSFADNATPINTIRAILNHYFGYDLPLIENSCCPDFYDLSHHLSNEIILESLSPKAS